MNAVIETILRAVRDNKVTHGTRALARQVLADQDRRDALSAGRACTTAKVAKKAIASVEHHRKARRAEEREDERVSEKTMHEIRERSTIDHRGLLCCEGCHGSRDALGPHHLELVKRTDRPDWVMLLCAGCHLFDPGAAHRAPRAFAQKIVIPWAKDHGFTLPNRKEYRDA